jgi:hypothetical protein
MRESVPDYLLFDTSAKAAFSILTNEFNYKLIESVTKPNYVRHTYRNRWRRRKIIIKNETFPVDYGFSFFIHNLWTKEHFILYNIPWEKEDPKCDFLNRVSDKIFKSQHLQNIIRGTTWQLKKDEFTFE